MRTQRAFVTSRRALILAMVSAAVAAAMSMPAAIGSAGAARVSPEPALISGSMLAEAQSGCPLIFTDGPVVVAPNQPEVKLQSTVGIINALCDVTLDFIGCGFTPTSITLGCDTNGDGVSDLSIPLKNITVINQLLVQATIPALGASPGTAFPLTCCGGVSPITLTRTVGAGDNNVFGPFTQTLTCSIDLGIRAPVVISATPVEGDCTLGQNLLIPGSCFLLPDGKPNVTSVFAVEAGNPNNVIQASPIHILTSNLLDAFFKPGLANAGKTFLIFAGGPNGTSRNLTALPPGARAGCPLGNEQGVAVTFKCKSSGGSGTGGPNPTPGPPAIFSCKIDRTESGGFSLTLLVRAFREGDTLTISDMAPKKLKLKDFDPRSDGFTRIIAKGRVCDGLPGPIVYTPANGQAAPAFFCSASCQNQ